MSKLDSALFPKYNKLSLLEKIFFRTCFYYPPRQIKPHEEKNIDIEEHKRVYEEAFGDDLWSLIEGKRVLDLGCGHGRYTLALADVKDILVTGLDLFADFKAAEQEGERRGYRNVSFVQGTTEMFESGSFDAVISHDSFEHFKNPENLLTEMVRLTKKGGYIFIKFGPTWRSPRGVHMTGTIRGGRPWIHLIIPERIIMRCHCVYHDQPALLEEYSQLPGGLNKMTVGRFLRILNRQEGIKLIRFQVLPVRSLKFFCRLAFIKEFFAGGSSALCLRV